MVHSTETLAKDLAESKGAVPVVMKQLGSAPFLSDPSEFFGSEGTTVAQQRYLLLKGLYNLARGATLPQGVGSFSEIKTKWSAMLAVDNRDDKVFWARELGSVMVDLADKLKINDLADSLTFAARKNIGQIVDLHIKNHFTVVKASKSNSGWLSKLFSCSGSSSKGAGESTMAGADALFQGEYEIGLGADGANKQTVQRAVHAMIEAAHDMPVKKGKMASGVVEKLKEGLAEISKNMGILPVEKSLDVMVSDLAELGAITPEFTEGKGYTMQVNSEQAEAVATMKK